MGFARRHFGVADAEALGRARFALIEIPHAAVRLTVRGHQPLPWLPSTVATASLAALDARIAAA